MTTVDIKHYPRTCCFQPRWQWGPVLQLPRSSPKPSLRPAGSINSDPSATAPKVLLGDARPCKHQPGFEDARGKRGTQTSVRVGWAVGSAGRSAEPTHIRGFPTNQIPVWFRRTSSHVTATERGLALIFARLCDPGRSVLVAASGGRRRATTGHPSQSGCSRSAPRVAGLALSGHTPDGSTGAICS
jgi:hypothetical protein